VSGWTMGHWASWLEEVRRKRTVAMWKAVAKRMRDAGSADPIEERVGPRVLPVVKRSIGTGGKQSSGGGCIDAKSRRWSFSGEGHGGSVSGVWVRRKR